MSNWKESPLDLIAKRVDIESASGLRHRGTVIRYNQFQQKHTVQYDDGATQDYDLYSKRFWIIDGAKEGFHPTPRPLVTSVSSTATESNVTSVNPNTVYGGNGYGTGGYAYPAGYGYQWVPYVSRTPNANTLTVFHILLDSRVSGVESVRITGNLDVLSGFRDGVPMVAQADNRCIWSVALHLPFTANDYHVHGMFQFHYELVMNDGSILPEGQGERTEQKLRPNFFHAFRPDYRLAQFRYSTALAPKFWFQSFIVAQKKGIKNNMLSLLEATQLYADLFDCCVGAARVHVEECFEDEIDIVDDSKIDMSPELFLYFLFAIGKFGLTSSEKVYAAYNYNYSLYGTMNDTGTMTFRQPPKPTQWVLFCGEKLDVPTLFAMNWESVLGSRQYVAVMGLVEAIERLAEHGNYSWMQLYPLTSKSGAHARIPKKANIGKKAIEEYVVTAELLCTMIHQQIELAQVSSVVTTANDTTPSEIANNEWAVVAVANDNIVANDDYGNNEFIGLGDLADENKDKFSPLKLAKKWIRTLVLHAPTLQHVVDLLQSLSMYQEHLIQPLIVRMENESFSGDRDLEILKTVMELIPIIKGPKLAAALFENTSMAKHPRKLLDLIELCVGEHESDTNSAVGASTMDVQVDPRHEPCKTEEMDALTGDWLTLNTSCKEWIQRTHAMEPAPVVEAAAANDNSSYAWFNVSYGAHASQPKPKKKELSDAELAVIRHNSLRAALVDLDSILRIPIFKKFPQGVLFELSRCWFLNGPIALVLEAIFTESTGGDNNPFATHTSIIGNYLEGKITKIIRDSTAFKQNMMTIATVTNRVLLKSSSLFHSVMLHLIVFTNNPDLVSQELTLNELIDESNRLPKPSLRSILENHGLWTVFIESIIDHSMARAMFDVLFVGAESVLVAIANDIVNDSVTIGSLNLISPVIDSFMGLLDVFRCRPAHMQRSVIETRLATLARFERQMEEVQTYASFFCSCGVRMNSADVRAIVDSIRSKYQSLQSKNLFFAFADVPALTHVSWLYDLRGSELFLQLWSSVGKEICFEQIAASHMGAVGGGPPGFPNTGNLAGNVAALVQLFNQGAVNQAGMPILPEQAPGAAAVVPPEGEDEAALPEEIRAERAAMRFAQRQQAIVMIEQVEDVVLDQNAIVMQLIPRVKRQWEEMAMEVFSGRIAIQRLDNVFSKKAFVFGSNQLDAKLAEELKMMMISYQATSSNADMNMATKRKIQIKLAFDRIKDFMLLRQLCKWVPSIVNLHEIVASLCVTSIEEDKFRALLQKSIYDIQSGWNQLILEDIPRMVKSAKGIFGSLSSDQLDFLSLLSSAPNLVQWLLARSSTEEFNRLLQVVRPCTDEPRLLSAIASLVHVRTLLLQPFYLSPPYSNLEEFLRAFQSLDMGSTSSTTTQQSDSAVWHLNNVISSFDALMDIFEKQTRSPGIKSCFDLRDIRERGTFVLKSSADASRILSVEILRNISSTSDAVTVPETGSDLQQAVVTESMEYLLDLRSKLLMTEIPPELEEEMQASQMVEAFVLQLQVLSEMGDMVATLHSSGHVDYQADFSLRIRFELDGLTSLQEQFAHLKMESQTWSNEVKENRSNYYFLNYFTMREILKMRTLTLQSKAIVDNENNMEVEPAVEVTPKSEATVAAERAERDLAESIALAEQMEADSMFASANDSLVMEMEQMGFSREAAIVSLHKSGYDVATAVDFCFSKGQQLDRIVAEELYYVLSEIESAKGRSGGFTEGFSSAPTRSQMNIEQFLRTELDPVVEIENFLHQISTQVPGEAAMVLMENWKTRLDAQEPILSSLGIVLNELFDDAFLAIYEDASASISMDVASTPATSDNVNSLRPPPPPGPPPPANTIAAISSKINSLSTAFAARMTTTTSLAANLHSVRKLTKPGATVANRGDLLYVLDTDTEKHLPVFVTCTEDPNLVIDTVLSIFIRRGRLPEPGEVLFCTTETTSEELNIFLLRFVLAKRHGFENSIFCIADLHNLSYTQQCTLVELLRALVNEHGQDNAATLAIISGLPRQMALNALSSQHIDLPPLPVKYLRTACKEAFEKHGGATLCVASTINGGGKSHHIKSLISQAQQTEEILYVKIPIRESTTPRKLIDLMLSAPSMAGARVAFHIDIGHIIPAAANTMLFQLLLVGVLQDPVSSRVFHRRCMDNVFIEIPNSLNNKTAFALRLSTMLPTIVLSVEPRNLSLTKPVFVDNACTQIENVEYSEMISVCKWLRAIKKKKLKRSSPDYNPDFCPEIDGPISANACYELLVESCCAPTGPSSIPSWSIFHTFIMFTNMQFSALSSYDLMNNGILDQMEGLENFRTVFVQLLLETSKDFSLRSVAQVPNVGPAADAVDATGAFLNDPTSMLRPAVSSDDIAVMQRGNSDNSEEEPSPAPPRRLTRQTSSEVRQAAQQAEVEAPHRMVRQTSEEMVARFQTMVSWEQSDHPIVSFKMSSYGGVSGVDILSLNPEFLNRYINGSLKQNLEHSGFNFARDWDKITNAEGVEILRQVEGLSDSFRGGVNALEQGYVMTIDNVLKMLSIQLRLRFNVPVIIMGETGCGKSTLIRNMCIILGVPLHTLNIHGGIEDADIISWMEDKIRIVSQIKDREKFLVVFLDEINTCNCMGLFKEIVCDRTMNGKKIHERIKIIAACNPYRLRKAASLYGGEEMAGLAFETFNSTTHLEGVGTGIKDPLRNLVYRVHPLPESMIDFVYDFGSLSEQTESLYIKAMLRRQLGIYNEDQPNNGHNIPIHMPGAVPGAVEIPRVVAPPLSPFNEFVEVFSDIVCAAQECIRRLSGGERSAASLRDVSRCVKVFIWFGDHFAKTCGSKEGWDLPDFFRILPKTQKYVRKAVVLSLAYCYHARLPRNERKEMVNAITGAWRELQVIPNINPMAGMYQYGMNAYYPGWTPAMQQANANWQREFQENYRRRKARCAWLNLDSNAFHGIVEEVQKDFVSKFALGDGIAMNEAILENLFMILISVLNQIPIFVIGKPGSSKSLAMGLIQSNLNGDASDNDFLRSLPAVEVFSYQCSPLSTSAGIEQAFESSRRYHREAQNTVVVVLLDEVGLAEQSPHLPLKVLHKMFDEAGDGEGVVGISNWALDPAKMNRAVHLYRPAPSVDDLSLTAEGMVRSANLKGYLRALARAYNKTYQTQEHPDFWGLREFYSTVRAINSSLTRVFAESGSEAVALDAGMLLWAVLRNYGGRPNEMEIILSNFFNELGLVAPRNWRNIQVERLIIQNLSEPDARHLMLLTRNNAALSLLFDRNIVSQDNVEIIFGSDFPLDQNDLQVCLNIQRVKLCMAEGRSVVLVHCESLYESLYDLLNQHYVEYGGQTYVRLAFGTYTRLCPIHKSFRVVVIVEISDAYTRLAPPLLNRFEKQVFERKDTLRSHQLPLLNQLKKFANAFALTPKMKASSSTSAVSGSADGSNDSFVNLRKCFCGYHSEMMSSLILSTAASVTAAAELARQRQMLETQSSSEDNNTSLGETVAMDIDNPETAAVRTKKMESIPDDEDLTNQLDTQNDEALFQECARRLLWIAAPEATCRLMGTVERERQIARDFGVDCSRIYFKEQRHSSLSMFVDQFNDWGDELGAQAVVMTYSPLSQDAVKSLHLSSAKSKQILNVSHVVLHELDQERSLRQAVTDFFKSASQGSTLLVQCDPLATSKRRIEHTKFILESARSKYLKTHRDNLKSKILEQPPASSDVVESRDPALMDSQPQHSAEAGAPADTTLAPSSAGINIILLLHLPRGDAEGDHRYCIDFDTRWRYAFVDSIVSADAIGLPDVEGMIGKNIMDVLASIDMRKALIKSFRQSLAKLTFSNERTNDDVRHQIITILACLDSKPFVATISAILQAMQIEIQSRPGSNRKDFELGSEATEDHLLLLTGTFQGALHMQILNTISDSFAVILSHIDRNESLCLLLNSSWEHAWEYLFKRSFSPKNVVMNSNVGKAHSRIIKTGVNTRTRSTKDTMVKSDGFNNIPFSSKFPFSFYLCPLLDSMRNSTQHAAEHQLKGQFSTLGLELGLDGDLDEAIIRAYCYDLLCMKCRPVVGLTRDQQSDLLFSLLEMCVPERAATSWGDLSPAIGEGKPRDDSPRKLNTDAEITQDSTPSTIPPLSSQTVNPAMSCLASVHHRFWRIERVLDLYFELMNCFPLSLDVVIDFITEKPTFMDIGDGSSRTVNGSMHKDLLDILFSILEPWTGASWDGSSSRSMDNYDFWLLQVASVKPHAHSLMDLIDNKQLQAEIHSRWARLDFFKAFVQNIAIPLDVSTAMVRSYLQRYDETCLGTHKSLCCTVQLLCALQAELLSKEFDDNSDYLCHITLQRMVDPVVAADGFNYERAAITAWLSSGHRTSPVTNLPLSHTRITPNIGLKERIELLEECDLSHFLEYFIFEVLFPSLYASVSIDSKSLSVLVDLVSLAAGALPQVVLDATMDESKSQLIMIEVLPSPAARIGIIRDLFALMAAKADHTDAAGVFRIVMNTLAEKIVALAKRQGFVDVPLAVACMIVQEEAFAESIKQNDNRPLELNASNIFICLDPNLLFSDPLLTLSNIAKIRAQLSAFAELICQQTSDSGIAEFTKLKAFGFSNEVSQFLHSFSQSSKSIVAAPGDAANAVENIYRGLKMFLLKQIEKKRGISFLRNTLLEPPLSLASWLIEWKQSMDVSFSRFLGSNKIPKVNPLTGFPLFGQIQELLSQFLLTGNTISLETGLVTIAGKSAKRVVQGSLLVACFHEIFLLSLLPLESTQGLFTRRQEFDAWLLSSTFLHSLFTSDEHRVFLTFASGTVRNAVVDPALSSSSSSSSGASSMLSPHQAFFVLTPESSADAILQLRVAAHVAAAALAADDSHPLAFFRSLMLAPARTKDSFYPTMEEDVLKMAQTVMGGRWYRCPNQHPYYVDMCGRPTIILNCKECGAQIGGLSHNLLDDNVDIGNVGTQYHQKTVVEDTTEKNYCLRTPEQESQDKFYSVRTLEPRGTRAIRVLMHLCMLAGSNALDSEWKLQMSENFNRSYCNPGDQVDEFIHQHIVSDWNLLATMMTRTSDDVSLLFHTYLLHCDPSTPPKFTAEPPAIRDMAPGTAATVAAVGEATNFSRLVTPADRSKWESWCGKAFSRYTNEETLVEILKSAEKKYSIGDDDDGGSFVLELLEKIDLNQMFPENRRSSIPGLLQHTRRFEFSHFQFKLGMVKGGAEKYPLLSSFLEQEPIFKSLKYISRVFEWFALLKTRFSGHIDRETAREKSCAEVISELDAAIRPRWMEVFLDFCSAWNNSWSFVQKFGCLSFSSDFVNCKMDLDTKLSFCLPNDKDEGLCPMALIEYLVTKHNELVQRVDEALLLRSKRSRQEASRVKAISSRFLTPAHCFNYNLSEFISFLEKQCVSFEGSIGYDFAKAEARLIERYLSALPAIDLELAGFIFAHEQQGTMVGLRQKLRQEPLSADAIASIRRDFTGPAQSFRMLDTIEIAIDFLSSTGGSMIDSLDTSLREMLLVSYMKSVLLVEDTIDSLAVTQQVRLKHLESLWSLLMELTASDPFEKVEARYKQPLTERMESDLIEAVSHVEFEVDKLLGCMKSFVLEQLAGNGNLSDQSKVYDVLAWRDVDNEFLSDINWFSDFFPQSLLMANYVEGYKFLQRINNR